MRLDVAPRLSAFLLLSPDEFTRLKGDGVVRAFTKEPAGLMAGVLFFGITLAAGATPRGVLVQAMRKKAQGRERTRVVCSEAEDWLCHGRNELFVQSSAQKRHRREQTMKKLERCIVSID